MALKAKKKAIHVNEEGLVMKKYICLLGVIVALIVDCRGVNSEKVDECLSRFLSEIRLVDGTNVVVKALEWNDCLLVSRNGSDSFGPVEPGAEIMVHCGESVTFSYSGAPSFLRVRVCCGVRPDELSVADDDGKLVIRIEDGASLDIRILPVQEKAYDMYAKEYIDFRIPFRSIWKNAHDMHDYFGRMQHIEFSKVVLNKATGIFDYVRNCVFTNRSLTAVGSCRKRSVVKFSYSSCDMTAYFADDGEMRGVLCKKNGECISAFVYSENGQLQEYVEQNLMNPRDGTVKLWYGSDGELSRSWHSHYIPQYIVVSNGVSAACTDLKAIRQYFDLATMNFNAVFGTKVDSSGSNAMPR